MTLQEKIIAELGVKPSIDPKEEIRVSVDFLKDYGCDIFQGYYFAKPMPIQEFEMNFLNKTVYV